MKSRALAADGALWRRLLQQGLALPLLLGIAVMVSAVAVVRVKHQNRLMTTDLQRLADAHAQLDMESAQLQLEEASLAQHSRIDQIAREQLGMSETRQYVIVEQLP